MEYFGHTGGCSTDSIYVLRYLTLEIPFKREHNLKVRKAKQIKKPIKNVFKKLNKKYSTSPTKFWGGSIPTLPVRTEP